MHLTCRAHLAIVFIALLGSLTNSAMAATTRIEGQVQAGGGAVAGSTVSLWAASAGAPTQLAQAPTGADGQFVITVDQTPAGASIFYLVAAGGTPRSTSRVETTRP